MNPQYLLWREIQDTIGEANTWPANIRKLFWKKKIDFWEFVSIAVFACMNKIDPKTFTKWVNMNGMDREKLDGKRVSNVADVFNHPDLLDLPSYNIEREQYETLNGEVMPSLEELGRTTVNEQGTIFIS
jgi:hypothetical protein